MRTLLAILVYFLLSFFSTIVAQTNSTQDKLDSLLLVVNESEKVDSNYLITLMNISDIYRDRDFKSKEALIYLLKVDSVAHQLNDREILLMNYQDLLYAEISSSKYDSIVNEVRAYLPDLNSFSNEEIIHITNIAIAFNDHQRYNESLEILHFTEIEIKKWPDPLDMLMGIEHLRYYLFNSSLDFTSADDALKNLLNYSIEKGDQNDILGAKVIICFSIFGREKFQESHDCYEKLLTDTTYQNLKHYSHVVQGLRDTYYELGQYKQSINYGRQVINRTPNRTGSEWKKMELLKSYHKLGDENSLIKEVLEIEKIMKEENNYGCAPSVNFQVGDFYLTKGDYKKAISNFTSAIDSLDVGGDYSGKVDEKIKTMKGLVEAHHLANNHEAAYWVQQKLLEEKRKNEKKNKEAATKSIKFATKITLEKNQNEQLQLKKQNQQQQKFLWLAGLLASLFLILGIIIWKQSKKIAIEKEKSEAILYKVMPTVIANRIQAGETSIADYFKNVTVIFIDIVDFTALSSVVAPVEILKLLNIVFSRMDQISENYDLEKIKTIGDCYMAVAGIPNLNENNLENALDFCLEVLDKIDGQKFNGHLIRLRIGVESGPAIAGVIGEKKFLFDLWGDTVNTASRMETNGIPGFIQTTRNVYDKAIDKYPFKFREIIDIKGKGEMEVFVLETEKFSV